MLGAANQKSEASRVGGQIAVLLNYYYQRFLQEADTIEKEQKIIAGALHDFTDRAKQSTVRKFIDKL
jgi:hypothetical protein